MAETILCLCSGDREETLEEKMEEDRKEKEIRRKPGRPSKAEEGVKRERSMSVSSVRSMDKYVKRKREEGEAGGRKEENIFKRSRMTERSPIRKEEVRSMFRELMEEMREMRKELKEQKEGVREEIKKEEFQEREERWRREREELRKEIEEIKRKVEGIRKQGGGGWEEEEGGKEGRVTKKEGGELEAKIKGLEKWRELEERERRRSNVVVKGIEVKGEGIEGEVRKIWKELEVRPGLRRLRR